ncbi:MAG: hypothetical protein ABI560_16560, partial [Myxococcales bacterium]
MRMRMIALVVGLAVFHASAAGAWGQSRPIPPPSTPSAIPAREPAQPPAYPPAPGVAPAAANAGGTAAGVEAPPFYIPPPSLVPPLRPLGPIVHLRADNPRARLQRLTLRWVDVCDTPCGQPVEPAGQYRVGGGTIKSSPVFQLPPGAHSVQITARTGSVVRYWIGVGLAINGAAFLAAAALFQAAPNNNNSATFDNSSMRDAQHAYAVGYLIAGIVSLAIGLPLWMGNNTTVEVR